MSDNLKSMIEDRIKNALTERKASPTEMRDWVFDKLENTDMTSSETKKAFTKQFGSSNIKHYTNAVSEYLD
jgi:hypothetical protein